MDPIGYLASLGISQAQFAADIKPSKASAKVTTSSKPATQSVAKSASKSSGLPAGATAESGTFVNGDTKIMNRVGKPSTSAQEGGYLPAGASWKYDGFIKTGGYTWITHVYQGQRIYLPVRQWNGNSSTPWGTFK
ncbi:SH3 domain-containing protein [Lacticaseibacillus sp. GG6-2]